MKKTILFLAANPSKTPPLRLDQELREIQNGIQRGNLNNKLILKTLWAPRPTDIRRAMLDYKPNIIHFSGHGYGEDGIAFENEAGQKILVDSNTLTDFFGLFSDTLECVVLNACYSEVQSNAIVSCIPYVIGISNEIADTSSQQFSVAFYDAIGAGKAYEFAFKLASNAIRWGKPDEYSNPVLKVREQVEESQRDNELRQDMNSNIKIEVKTDESYSSLIDPLASLLKTSSQNIGIYREHAGTTTFAIEMSLANVTQLKLLLRQNNIEFHRLGVSRVEIVSNSQIEEWTIQNGQFISYLDIFTPRRTNEVNFGKTSLKLTVRSYANFTMVVAVGRIDSYTGIEFSNVLKEITDKRQYKIAIDMTELEFMSSAGLRVIIGIQKICKRYNRGQLVLLRVPENIYDILNLAGFTPLFSFVNDKQSITEIFSVKPKRRVESTQ